MNLSPEWIILYLGLFAIILELFLGVSTGFDLLIIGAALLIGGAVGVVTENWQIGLAVSSILALGYIMLGRKYLRRSLTVVTTSTNIDRIVGLDAIVTRPIEEGLVGQVIVDGEVWRAQSLSDLDVGSQVRVASVEGVTLNVIPAPLTKPKRAATRSKKVIQKGAKVAKSTKARSKK